MMPMLGGESGCDPCEAGEEGVPVRDRRGLTLSRADDVDEDEES